MFFTRPGILESDFHLAPTLTDHRLSELRVCSVPCSFLLVLTTIPATSVAVFLSLNATPNIFSSIGRFPLTFSSFVHSYPPSFCPLS